MAGPTVVLAAVRNVSILPIHKWMVGDAIVFQFTVVDATGAPRNINGWTLQWTLRESPTDPDITLQKSVTVTSAVAGLCTAAIVASDTASLPPRKYAHALRRTDSGAEETVAWGPAYLMRQAGA